MKTFNIFISHAWRYSDHYYQIVEWLDKAKSERLLDYKNYSVPVHDPLVDPNAVICKARLRELLDGQIKPASISIVLSGMYVAHSEWIEYEIDKSLEFWNYIIGVEPWGQERVPAKVKDNANIMVGWNYKSLINAILTM